MIRLACIVLAIALLPSPTDAQGLAGGPGAGATPQPSAAVTSVEVVGAGDLIQDVLSYESRRTLLESRPFEVVGTPAVPVGDRSVFFDLPEAQSQGAIVVLEGVRQAPAVPVSVFHSAGWLLPEGEPLDPLGQITSFADARGSDARNASGQVYQDVYIRFSGGGSPQVGEELLVYEISRTVPGVGDVAAPSGRVSVLAVTDGAAVAQIIQGFGRLEAGHLVARAAAYPLEEGVRPIPTASGLETRILAFQEAKEIYLPGDFAFVEGGSGAGLALGDELRGLSDDESDWADPSLARFQVVGLGEDFSTVRVLIPLVPSAVRPGLRLVVDRKMP